MTCRFPLSSGSTADGWLRSGHSASSPTFETISNAPTSPQSAATASVPACLTQDPISNPSSPGWVTTPRQVELWVDQAAEEEIARNQCLPGKLLPEHIAAMCLFLGADDSAMCTAQDFIVDAGWV